MKVLFQSRKTLFSDPGGDTMQMLKTAEYLRKLGISVDISMELEPHLDGYDVVHLFNLIRPQEVLIQVRNAKRQGKHVALSTIYVDYSEYEKHARKGLIKRLSRILPQSQIEYLKTAARAVIKKEFHKGAIAYFTRGHINSQNEIISLVDIFLPNSESEMQRVLRAFPGAASKGYIVVPNAADTEIFRYENCEDSVELRRFKDCILCVARIEGRKNQLNLVRAMEDLPWPLVLLGKPSPNHVSYYQQVKKEAGPDVHILGEVEHNQLPRFYKAAKVHCLISWMETTGLSSLEAGLMGCNLLITDKGDTRDYFGDYAYYCNPDSVESIRQQLIRAHDDPVNPALRKSIYDNYNWRKTAEKTLESYLTILRNKGFSGIERATKARTAVETS